MHKCWKFDLNQIIPWFFGNLFKQGSVFRFHLQKKKKHVHFPVKGKTIQKNLQFLHSTIEKASIKITLINFDTMVFWKMLSHRLVWDVISHLDLTLACMFPVLCWMWKGVKTYYVNQLHSLMLSTFTYALPFFHQSLSIAC